MVAGLQMAVSRIAKVPYTVSDRGLLSLDNACTLQRYSPVSVRVSVMLILPDHKVFMTCVLVARWVAVI